MAAGIQRAVERHLRVAHIAVVGIHIFIITQADLAGLLVHPPAEDVHPGVAGDVVLVVIGGRIIGVVHQMQRADIHREDRIRADLAVLVRLSEQIGLVLHDQVEGQLEEQTLPVLHHVGQTGPIAVSLKGIGHIGIVAEPHALLRRHRTRCKAQQQKGSKDADSPFIHRTAHSYHNDHPSELYPNQT